MAKKTEAEQTATNIRKGLKFLTEEIDNLRRKVNRHEKTIAQLKREKEEKEEEFDNNFRNIFGVKYDEYLRGYGFEKHVVWWMNQYFNQYDLKIWQGDKFAHPYVDGDKISASWNTYPDLIYVDEVNKKAIALECKYRNDGRLELERRQYDNYRKFESQIRSLMRVDVSVFIVGGSRGLTSDRPDYMYCIPLDFFADKEIVDFREIPEYKVYERGLSNVIKDNIPF